MVKARRDLMPHLRNPGVVDSIQNLRKQVRDLQRAPVRIDVTKPDTVPAPQRGVKRLGPTIVFDSLVLIPDPVVIGFVLPDPSVTQGGGVAFGALIIGNFDDADPTVTVLDLVTGAEQSTFSLTTDASSPTVYANGRLFATDQAGTSFLLPIDNTGPGPNGPSILYANGGVEGSNLGEYNRWPYTGGTVPFTLSDVDMVDIADLTALYVVGKSDGVGPYGIIKFDRSVTPDPDPGASVAASVEYGTDGQHYTFIVSNSAGTTLYLVSGKATGADIYVYDTDLNLLNTFTDVPIAIDMDIDETDFIWAFDSSTSAVNKIDPSDGSILDTITLTDPSFVAIAAGGRYDSDPQVDRGYSFIYVLYDGGAGGSGYFEVYRSDTLALVGTFAQTGSDLTKGIAVYRFLP